MARKKNTTPTKAEPSNISPASSQEQETATYRLYQGQLLAEYEDKTRNALMDLVHQIETESGTSTKGSQKDDLANLIASYAEANATKRELSDEEVMQLLRSVRDKFRETVEGEAGAKGTAYGKLLSWYGRELDKLAKGKGKKN
ncbi:hypothetical protein CP533_1898 [Ophiocordyceps camponoti-saundersi (nom. inval.)]|nr:hypothetical protein CP533_1898 [Ophiocordyceps camponoti-saundersi (nom. inval.)]